MRVLLAVDGSACSDMAVQAVIDGFRPDATQVRVLHAVEWMREMPLCFQYAHGPKAGDDVVECRNKSFDRARWSNGLRRSSSSRASIRACRHPMRTRAMALSRQLASGRLNLSSWDRTGGGGWTACYWEVWPSRSFDTHPARSTSSGCLSSP